MLYSDCTLKWSDIPPLPSLPSSPLTNCCNKHSQPQLQTCFCQCPTMPSARGGVLLSYLDSTDFTPSVENTFPISFFRLGQPLPEVGVRVKNNILQFTTMGPAINGYYRCEASNVHGRELADLLMHVVLGEALFLFS